MPPTDALRERATTIYTQLEGTVRTHDYAGWDPFDGLNSQLFNATPLKHWPFARLAWLQLFKRLPLNLRPLTFVPRVHNAKALSLFARAQMLQGDAEESQRLITEMLALRSDKAAWGEGAWGYPFAWQARAFYVPKGQPNMICTAYAVKALSEHEQRSDKRYSSIIAAAADFVFQHLACTTGDGAYIGYIPGSRTMVHNANLWGAYVLAEGYKRSQNPGFMELMQQALAYSLEAQQNDGSWIYGEASHHRFIDGFHTGYNLEALDLCRTLIDIPSPAIDQAIARGMDYYMAHCSEEDGTPKYYANNRWPIDCHSASQAIITLLTVNPNPTQTALAEKVLEWTLGHMWDQRRNRFIYQRTQHYANNVPYIRWTQSWMLLALAVYHSRAQNAADNS